MLKQITFTLDLPDDEPVPPSPNPLPKITSRLILALVRESDAVLGLDSDDMPREAPAPHP